MSNKQHHHMFVDNKCDCGTTIAYKPDLDYLLKYYMQLRLEGMSDTLAMDIVKGLADVE